MGGKSGEDDDRQLIAAGAFSLTCEDHERLYAGDSAGHNGDLVGPGTVFGGFMGEKGG